MSEQAPPPKPKKKRPPQACTYCNEKGHNRKTCPKLRALRGGRR